MANYFDLIDIRLFINITETKSFTHGAVLSHMCLSAASKRIKHIEARLGAALFFRGKQELELTPAGQTFYHDGRRILHQLDRLLENLQGYTTGLKTQVRIFAPTTVSTEYLPGVLCKFLTAHADVDIDLRMRPSLEVVRAVIEEIADIGIIARQVQTEGLEVLPYRRDRWVLITALKNPLATRETVWFEEALEFDFVSLPESSTAQVTLNEAANALQRPLKIRVQAANLAILCRMVESNLGVGMLPESVARVYAKSAAIRTILVMDEWTKYEIQICVRKLNSLSRHARELVELLVEDGTIVSGVARERLPSVERNRSRKKIAHSRTNRAKPVPISNDK